MQVSDDLYLGTAYAPGNDPANPTVQDLGVGPMGRVYLWDVVPLTLNTAGLATSANPGSGAGFTLVAGTGVTARTRADGVIEYVLDTPRCVTATAAGANSATYLVTGYDQYGQRMTAALAAPSSSTTATTKAFKTIISVANNNATATTNGVTIGFNDKLGLPVACTNAAYIINVKWDATLAANAGTFVAADATAATASTTDVRGCYTAAGNAANGARRLVMLIGLPAIASGSNATRAGAYGVPQA